MKSKKIFFLIMLVTLLFLTGCNKKSDILKGKWKASIENQKIYQMDDGTITGGQKEYILECNGEGYYDLREGNSDLANAAYKISKDTVTFYDEGREVLAICKLKDNNKTLDCSKKSYYAVKYIKTK